MMEFLEKVGRVAVGMTATCMTIVTCVYFVWEYTKWLFS